MASAQFHILFDGPALENNEMDVRDLAPALLAVSDIFDEINTIALGNRFKVSVNVRGSFKTGSFLTDLAVHTSTVLSMFNGETATAALNMLQIIGIPGILPTGWGLITFIGWVRRRKITRVVELGKGKVRVEVTGDSTEVEEAILELYKSYKLRKAFEKLITNSLQKDGIDTVGFGNKEAKDFIYVTKEEKDSFIADEPEDEVLGASTRRTSLQIISPCFQEGNKWRFSDGSMTYHAQIADQRFIEQVMSGELVFGRGDILDVDLSEEQRLTAEGLKTERTIEKVHGHRTPIRQYRLPEG
jgi:hypothetical protein